MLVAAYPILTSNDEGPVRGTVVMGRLLDKDIEGQLRDQTKVNFTLLPVSKSTPVGKTPSRSAKSSQVSFVEEQSGSLLAYAYLVQINGDPARLLRVETSRTITAKGHEVVSNSMYAILAVSGVLLLTMWAAFRSLVQRPIEGIIDRMKEIRLTGDLPKSVGIKAGGEIGLLSAEFDRLMSQKAEYQRQIEHSLAKLEEANIHLEEANRHKSRFLASMSHELRTPLNVILGNADLLARKFYGRLEEKQAFFVQQIDESGNHLLNLINDLLDMVKIDAGAAELLWEKFPPEQYIDATVTMMGTQFRTKQLTVEVKTDPAVTAITGDRRKCKQILLNLLSNAIKYTPEGGNIKIHTVRQGQAVKLSVIDSGVGIAADRLKDIFSEFVQADRKRDEGLGGMGIGLALTQRLVQLHGGEIGVESELGRGSTFWFTLPFSADLLPPDDKQEDVEHSIIPQNRGSHILVAEDNEGNLQMVLNVLAINDYLVIAARNGQEAVEFAQEHVPELILIDIRMPVMDGLEATRRIRAIPELANVPIVALTASISPDMREKIRAAGCDDYLAKPIQSKQLLEVLDKYLQRQEVTR
jgi:signal transduction histidine kinase/ActR/RegA family two-component response regulator